MVSERRKWNLLVGQEERKEKRHGRSAENVERK
jgi:hypothetical protein